MTKAVNSKLLKSHFLLEVWTKVNDVYKTTTLIMMMRVMKIIIIVIIIFKLEALKRRRDVTKIEFQNGTESS